MKYLTMVIISLALMACQRAETSNVSHDFIMPEKLKDCEIIKLSPEGVSSDTVYVLDCPEGFRGTSSESRKTKHTAVNSIHVL